MKVKTLCSGIDCFAAIKSLLKPFIILLLIFLPLLSKADVILSPGAVVTSSYKSDEMDSSGVELLKVGSSFGLEADFEIVILKILTLNIGGMYFAGNGESQYDFKSTTASGLDTASVVVAGVVGPRLRFINFKRFKMFLGGGYLFGSQNLTYDKEEFETITGNTTNFESSDSASFKGHYLEGGMEYVMSNVSALRLTGRQLKYQSNEFRTLGAEQISVSPFQVAVQYLHYINWGLFWK